MLLWILILACFITGALIQVKVHTTLINGAGRSEDSIGLAPRISHSFLSYMAPREMFPNSIKTPSQSLSIHSNSSNLDILFKRKSPGRVNDIESVTNRSMEWNLEPRTQDTLPQDVINDVQKFVFFIGYPRSGHSIIGSMMDAHPNIVIAHELFLFRGWWSKMEKKQRSFTKSLIFRSIYESSLADAYKGWRNKNMTAKGYSLDLVYPWQGRYNGSIQIIGDKSGGDTAFAYMQSPSQFRAKYKVFIDAVGIPIRIIHVVRNPFDIISTTMLYEKGKMKYPGRGRGAPIVADFVRRCKIYVQQVKNKTSDANEIENSQLDDSSLLKYLIFKFFKMADAVRNIIELVGPENVIELHNYELVKDPAGTMLKICHFLGLSCPKDYLDACVRKTFKTLSVSREYVLWREEDKLRVELLKQDYPFFQQYSFDSKV